MPASVVRRVTMPDEGIESLFGSLDENLRNLEAALRVTIKTSGHDLMLEGDQGDGVGAPRVGGTCGFRLEGWIRFSTGLETDAGASLNLPDNSGLTGG